MLVFILALGFVVDSLINTIRIWGSMDLYRQSYIVFVSDENVVRQNAPSVSYTHLTLPTNREV